MPDLTIDEADRCPTCDAILYGSGPCSRCGDRGDLPGGLCGASRDRGARKRPRFVTCTRRAGHEGKHIAEWGVWNVKGVNHETWEEVRPCR